MLWIDKSLLRHEHWLCSSENVIPNYCLTVKQLGSLKICSGDCGVTEGCKILTGQSFSSLAL